MHPKYSIDRKYLVRVYGKVEKKNIEALKKGILIGDEYSRFKNIEYKNEVLKNQVRLNKLVSSDSWYDGRTRSSRFVGISRV